MREEEVVDPSCGEKRAIMSEVIRSETIGSETIRAFLAFVLPPEVKASIEEIQNHLKSFDLKMRWVRPENIHLTVKFLGGIRPQDVERIREAGVRAVRGVEPFSLRAEGVGVFPNRTRAKVVWAGIAGETPKLAQFAGRTEEALLAMGFEKESRPFKGHLTLGRAKGRIDPEKIAEALQSASGFVSESFTADRLFLFKSELTAAGAVYTRLVEINFGIEATGGEDDFIAR
jgi:2'-5' RNA ligase